MHSESIRSTVQALRADIATSVQHARDLREKATRLLRKEGAASGPQRHRLRRERLDDRPWQRLRYLALAYLRGRPYGSAERTSNAVPRADAIAACASPGGRIPDAALVSSVQAWLDLRPPASPPVPRALGFEAEAAP